MAIGGSRGQPSNACCRPIDPGAHRWAAPALTPSRIARTYRRASRSASTELPWVVALTDEQRTLFRERGQILAAGLLQYLDAGLPETAAHHLKEASVTAAEHGRVAASLGLSLSQTIEGFLRFRAPFHPRAGR